MPHMLPDERRRLLEARLARDGTLVASELAAELGVSVDTIRRDIEGLAVAGQAHRVRGGALRRADASPHLVRRGVAADEKRGLAALAAGLVRDGQVVIFDAGSTTERIAELLPDDLHATCITNSPPVAMALAAHPGLTVTLVGGRLLPDQLAAVGSIAVDAFRAIRADGCFLGACSIDPEAGIGANDPEEAEVKRAMVAGASMVVAPVAADKLGTVAPFLVAPIGALTDLVVDAGVPEETLALYRAAGITVHRGA